MHRPESPNPTDRVARLARQLSLQPRLDAEVMRARRLFFGPDGMLSATADRAREHRFAEWFLIERESEMLGAVPVDVPPFAAHAGDLRDSMAGAFLVQATGETTTALDLQDDSVVELLVEPGVLHAGDLLVGRLFPAWGERWQPSAAAPVLRPGRDIASAFARDVERLELDRRLQQIELEHLLLHRSDTPEAFAGVLPAEDLRPLEHLEADLEQLLHVAGAELGAAQISQQLALADRPGVLIGPLLDQLAFETDVDLERAQRLLLEIWNAHHQRPTPSTEQPTPSSSGPPGLTLGERLVRTLDEGLAQHRDVEGLFREIERMAGIDADDDDDEIDADDDDAGIAHEVDDGDDGDLGPLVTEYLWETNQDDAPMAAILQLWVDLQRNAAVRHTDVETVVAQDLMRLLLHVYLRSAPAERVEEVRTSFTALQRFYDWLHLVHEIDQRAVLQQCHGTLLDQLDRLAAASQALSSDRSAELAPGLLTVEDVADDGFGVRDDEGAHHWLHAGGDAVRELRVGDLVLGGLTGGDGVERQLAGMVVVLPIDARALIE